MAGNSIITPGYEEPNAVPEEVTPTELYLVRDNYLAEYADENEAAIVRLNLNVPSTDFAYDKATVDIKIAQTTKKAIEEYLNAEDPHGILPLVDEKILGMVKLDGSTPFMLPQTGVEPISDNHLTTKKFVTRLLNEHKNADDPHEILPEVEILLENYLKISDVYKKSQLYTKDEIDTLARQYLKKDGSTPFTKALIGIDPTSEVHLATKRYVDKKVYLHIIDVDPHGFITILNQRLASYAKSKDVYDKTLTYSRTLIDNEISKIVDNAINQSLQEYKDSINDRFETIRKERFVKLDGSTPFKNPLIGVEATQGNHLVTLSQLDKSILDVSNELSDKIKNETCIWVTSGPVEATVGFLENNSRVPEKMTVLEVLDAIFYGKRVSVSAPEIGKVGLPVDVTVCITGGDLNTVDLAELYLNGKLIGVFLREDFLESGCITITSDEITEDTEFEFKVYYSNDAEHSEYAKTKLAYPIFVGILPEWYFGTNVTYGDLVELSERDPINNKFYDRASHLRELFHQYNFDTDRPVKLILALPKYYPDLVEIMNGVLKFTSEAFTEESLGVEGFSFINVTPFTVNNVLTDYKLYIYNQPLVRLDSKIIFKF